MTTPNKTRLDAAARLQLTKLARAALAATYGTQEHDDAHNAFCEDATGWLSDADYVTWEAFTHKATSAETVFETCRLLGLTLPTPTELVAEALRHGADTLRNSGIASVVVVPTRGEPCIELQLDGRTFFLCVQEDEG